MNRSLAAVVFLALSSALGAQPRGATPSTPQLDPFRFQMMGPAEGGRFASITGVPGDARVWYVGAASGGVWKSVDSGATFRPVFDSMPVQAIGALAVAPSKPSIVWAGTGEAWAIRDADLFGDGVYRSTDSGTTWKNMGLPESGRIQRILVHPTNPDIVYVCVLGRATGPQQERGVYRTSDGGKTWARSLFVDENTGCSGLTMDAKNPNVLFAGTWQVVMHTYAMYSGGRGSAIYATHDGGTTWTKAESAGLPRSPLGKIDVAIAPTNSKRVYALIQTADQGSLWRSDDGGVQWKVVNHQRPLIGRAGYYIHLAVSSGDANEILIANSSFFRSKDGGLTFEEVPWGGDNHDIWIDPKNPNHIGLTNDASARLTTDHGKTWQAVSLPIGQMYHVAVDDRTPYWVYGNRQDNGTMRGPSTAPEATTSTRGIAAGTGRGRGGGRGAADSAVTGRAGRAGRAGRGQAAGVPVARDTAAADSTGGGRGGGGGGTSTWDHGLGGCESGFTLPDLTDPNIIWASCYGNEVTRYDYRTKRARSVSPWIHTLDSPPQSLKYRCHWTPPLAIDPFDHNTVYYGCQVVFKTSNGGQHWDVISPDLSTRDPSRIVSSGGIVEDNLGQFYGEVVFAIAPSEIQRGLIWAGTNDGKVWNTRDGGANWSDVSKGMDGLPAWGTVRRIEPSHFDPATAYVAIDLHMMDDRRPFIYKTTDFGKTWTNVTGNLPATSPLDYVMAVAENPNRNGMLFAGTGHSFYYSMDDGAHWTMFDQGLPHSAVSWIVVPKKWHDVVVSTYGRGVFILRDIAPLEAPSETQLAGMDSTSVRLYTPHPGYRQARSGRAEITFALGRVSQRPARIEILDSANKVVRTLNAPTRAGYNRATWDLRYDPPKNAQLKTVAPDNPFIFQEPRFKNKTTRPVVHWGINQAQIAGPLALAGSYTVRLTVSGKTETQRLTILRDPEIKTTDADLAAAEQTQVRVRDDMNAAVDMINRLETMRKQIADLRAAKTTPADAVGALVTLERKMFDVELKLLSRSDMDSDDKYYPEAYKVYLNLIWLNGVVGTGAGDVAGGADEPPTESALSWLGDIEKDLDSAKSAYKSLIESDVAGFNKSMSGKLPAIVEVVQRPVP